MTDLEARVQQGLRATYAINRTIGIGGMGIVFLAQDLKHDRRVAIKIMRPEITAAGSEKRFLREMMTVARLTHPGILPVHDSGVVDGLLYYVMPYVEDGSLRDLLEREQQLPVDRAIAIAADIGDAVSYAHAQRIIHRDLKPENILLESGHPVIADFGLALTLQEGSLKTTGSALGMGTPAYMAPEQSAGSAHVDGRADVYALGCILYEMLAGEPPITGPNTQGIIARKMLGRIPGLREVRPTVSRSTERAISKALSPVPADRFDTVDGFVRALRRPASRSARLVSAAVAAVLILTAGAASFVRSGDIVDPNSVVVDEFENRTGDSTLARIGGALADWTAQGLQSTRLLSVVPTPAALQASRYARRQTATDQRGNPLALVARETGAGLIVSGAYYRNADSLTFHTQLSSAKTGFWQRLFHSGLRVELRTTLRPVIVHRDSAQRAIREIGSRVMGALSLAKNAAEYSAPQLERAPPTFEAYERFNVGMDAYIANDYTKATDAFLEAYRTDTTFVVALLYSALARSNMQQWAIEDSLLQIVARSTEQLSTYHRLWLEYRQRLIAQDRPGALRAVRALAAEAPRSKATYNLAIEAWEDGHLEESVEALRSLRPEMGPVRDFLPYWGALATVEHSLGNYGEALKVSRRARAAHPDKLWPIAWELGAMAALGDVDAVVDRAEKVADAPRDEMGWAASEVLREVAEELRAHGHRGASETVWKLALRGYRSTSSSGRLPPREQLGWGSTLYVLRQYDEADKVTRNLLAAQPADVRAIGQLGSIAARQGDTAAALATVNRLASMNLPYQFGRPAYQAALVAAALGENHLALQLLRRALAEGRAHGSWTHREIDLEALRRTRPFQALVRPVPLKPTS